MFVKIERTFAGDPIGEAATAWAACCPSSAKPLYSRDPRLQTVRADRALFLDTETTGLGGAGCLVFLVGTLHFSAAGAVLTQFVLPSPGSERLFLNHVWAFVEQFDYLVTYNGRAFDVRALQDRFRMTRMEGPARAIEDLPNLDLLAPARRIWQWSAPDCRLGTLECEVLGRRRERDLPGWAIPAAYYRFLHTGRTREMHDILAHNQEDLITLLLLGVEMTHMIATVQTTTEASDRCTPDAMLGLGTLLVAGGAAEQGRLALQQGVNSASPLHRYMARKHLAALSKRAGNLTEAADLWQAMIEENVPGETHAYHELAKYHEHAMRDLKAALAVVESALSSPHARVQREWELLDRRYQRLRRRLAGRGQGD